MWKYTVKDTATPATWTLGDKELLSKQSAS